MREIISIYVGTLAAVITAYLFLYVWSAIKVHKTMKRREAQFTTLVSRVKAMALTRDKADIPEAPEYKHDDYGDFLSRED